MMCGECNWPMYVDPEEEFMKDMVYDPKTGEIYRTVKWITKEEAIKMFPEEVDDGLD